MPITYVDFRVRFHAKEEPHSSDIRLAVGDTDEIHRRQPSFCTIANAPGIFGKTFGKSQEFFGRSCPEAGDDAIEANDKRDCRDDVGQKQARPPEGPNAGRERPDQERQETHDEHRTRPSLRDLRTREALSASHSVGKDVDGVLIREMVKGRKDGAETALPFAVVCAAQSAGNIRCVYRSGDSGDSCSKAELHIEFAAGKFVGEQDTQFGLLFEESLPRFAQPRAATPGAEIDDTIRAAGADRLQELLAHGAIEVKQTGDGFQKVRGAISHRLRTPRLIENFKKLAAAQSKDSRSESGLSGRYVREEFRRHRSKRALPSSEHLFTRFSRLVPC